MKVNQESFQGSFIDIAHIIEQEIESGNKDKPIIEISLSQGLPVIQHLDISEWESKRKIEDVRSKRKRKEIESINSIYTIAEEDESIKDEHVCSHVQLGECAREQFCHKAQEEIDIDHFDRNLKRYAKIHLDQEKIDESDTLGRFLQEIERALELTADIHNISNSNSIESLHNTLHSASLSLGYHIDLALYLITMVVYRYETESENMFKIIRALSSRATETVHTQTEEEDQILANQKHIDQFMRHIAEIKDQKIEIEKFSNRLINERDELKRENEEATNIITQLFTQIKTTSIENTRLEKEVEKYKSQNRDLQTRLQNLALNRETYRTKK